ncbi:hypothetical protein WR25_23961 [Diploscapter pachys]|uniref:Tyrosine-protein kinase n=1 Tax=Diploscapter pachys TaxID=2018661 RepID=A0A2A2LA54_9BILA|nr:hypothetical protein WR25_23961 [Diploscapter pachys]
MRIWINPRLTRELSFTSASDGVGLCTALQRGRVEVVGRAVANGGQTRTARDVPVVAGSQRVETIWQGAAIQHGEQKHFKDPLPDSSSSMMTPEASMIEITLPDASTRIFLVAPLDSIANSEDVPEKSRHVAELFSRGISFTADDVVRPVTLVECSVVEQTGRAVHEVGQAVRAGQEAVVAGGQTVVAIQQSGAVSQTPHDVLEARGARFCKNFDKCFDSRASFHAGCLDDQVNPDRSRKSTAERLIQISSDEVGMLSRPLEDEGYYHGYLTRDEAGEIIKKPGEFLVRKTVLQNHKRLFWVRKFAFKSIGELIEYHVRNREPVHDNTPVCKKNWQLNHEQVEVGKLLGAGAFGQVFKGQLQVSAFRARIPVAVKTLTNSTYLTEDERIQFLREANTMLKIRHPNVVKFYGVGAQKEPIMIVMEFCHGGSLESLLRKEPCTDTQKINFVHGAAKGMAYVELMKIIHRDIASRNCLLGSKNEIKISDFGLAAIGTEYKDRKMKNVPARWMIELKFEQWAPNNMLELYKKCHSFEPQDRPSFEQIRDRVAERTYTHLKSAETEKIVNWTPTELGVYHKEGKKKNKAGTPHKHTPTRAGVGAVKETEETCTRNRSMFRKTTKRPAPQATRRRQSSDEEEDETEIVKEGVRKKIRKNPMIQSTIRKERQNEELSSSSSGEEQGEYVGAVLDEFSYKATGDSAPAGPRDMGATAVLEIDTDKSADAQTQFERVQEQLKEGLQKDGKTLYKGAAMYGAKVAEDSVKGNASSSYVRMGPVRAPQFLRQTVRWDFAPDICKDYKETGFCTFGDSCKFLHDRSDYKHGWEIERDYQESLKSGKVDDDVDYTIHEDEEQFPEECYICGNEFVDPIVTKCKHYFCERCALKSFKKSLKCPVCTENTNGVMNAVKPAMFKKKKKAEKQECHEHEHEHEHREEEEGVKQEDEDEEEGEEIKQEDLEEEEEEAEIE